MFVDRCTALFSLLSCEIVSGEFPATEIIDMMLQISYLLLDQQHVHISKFFHTRMSSLKVGYVISLHFVMYINIESNFWCACNVSQRYLRKWRVYMDKTNFFKYKSDNRKCIQNCSMYATHNPWNSGIWCRCYPASHSMNIWDWSTTKVYVTTFQQHQPKKKTPTRKTRSSLK